MGLKRTEGFGEAPEPSTRAGTIRRSSPLTHWLGRTDTGNGGLSPLSEGPIASGEARSSGQKVPQRLNGQAGREGITKLAKEQSGDRKQGSGLSARCSLDYKRFCDRTGRMFL